MLKVINRVDHRLIELLEVEGQSICACKATCRYIDEIEPYSLFSSLFLLFVLSLSSLSFSLTHTHSNIFLISSRCFGFFIVYLNISLKHCYILSLSNLFSMNKQTFFVLREKQKNVISGRSKKTTSFFFVLILSSPL